MDIKQVNDGNENAVVVLSTTELKKLLSAAISHYNDRLVETTPHSEASNHYTEWLIEWGGKLKSIK